MKTVKNYMCASIIFFMLVSMCGCGKPAKIDGTVYDTYGFLTEKEKRNPDIKYRIIVGNVVWAVILCETIVAPIYFMLFDLFEPVRKIDPNAPKGSL